MRKLVLFVSCVLLILCCGSTSTVQAQNGGQRQFTVQESDGSPSSTRTTYLRFPNGSLSKTSEIDMTYTGGGSVTAAMSIEGNLQLSRGLTIGNDEWIAADDSTGTGFINMLKVNTSDAIDVGGTLNAGTIKLEEDSGLVTLVNQPVSSSVSDGTEQGYTFAVDSNEILRVSALSDGTGGVDTKRITLSGNLEFSNNLTVAAAGTSNTTYISVFDTNGNKYTIAAVKDVT